MTDRVNHLVVYLSQDQRVDDVEELMRAISMMKGVAEVTLGSPVSIDTHCAYQRVKSELTRRILDMLRSGPAENESRLL